MLNERHELSLKERHNFELNRNQQSESRHCINMQRENEKLLKKENVKQNKLLNRYYHLYMSRKQRENQRQEIIRQRYSKYNEKIGRLEEIQIKNEERRNRIIKKLQIKRNKVETKSVDEISNRSLYFESCKAKRRKMRDDMIHEKNHILGYQTIIIGRRADKDQQWGLHTLKVREKNIHYQMDFEKNLKTFYRQLEAIKSDSIFKKPIEARRKIFKEIKRQEAIEKRKKELEDELL